MSATKHRPYLRSRIGEKLVSAGMMPVLRPLHDRGRVPIVVLAYHRVTPLAQLAGDVNPFDQDLVSAVPEEFEWQMQHLVDNFDVIPLSRLVEHLSGRKIITRASVVVTFDDGFSDNYTYAYPILKKLNVPATIFLSTEMVDSGAAIWFQLVSYLMMKSPVGSILVDGLEDRLPTSNDEETRRGDARRLQRYMKSLPHRRFQAILAELKTAMPPETLPESLQEARAITWEQAKEMTSGGIQFGSHTVSHGILAKMEEADQQFELGQSKRRIEEMLGTTVYSIAYPVGRFASINDNVFYHTSCAGYRLAACYEPGVNWSKQMNPLCLLRQNVELSTTRSRFRALVGLPNWIR
jgi:peptidoglycan/xylan/chitin deacetylase (PgdA/CDA1 family)